MQSLNREKEVNEPKARLLPTGGKVKQVLLISSAQFIPVENYVWLTAKVTSQTRFAECVIQQSVLFQYHRGKNSVQETTQQMIFVQYSVKDNLFTNDHFKENSCFDSQIICRRHKQRCHILKSK